MIIEKLINQLHTCTMTQNQRKSNSYLKSFKTERKPFAKHLTTFEQTLLKAKGLK
jgi:hypothetical protein